MLPKYLSFRVFDGLPRTKEEIEKHIASLKEMAKNVEHKDLFLHLYECLSILDSKSSSLLTFNSIIFAIVAIFFINEKFDFQIIALSLVMIFILISSFLLLNVVWVQWSTSNHLIIPDEHINTLLKVRKERTILYRISWNFSVLSIVFILVFLIIKFLVFFINYK